MDTNEKSLIKIEDNKKENPKAIIIVIIFVIMALIIGVAILALCGVFKSKGERFIELLTKEQYVLEMIENRAEDFADDGETKYNVTLKKEFLSTIDATFMLLGNDLFLDANIVKQDENLDTNAILKFGKFELQSLELIKEDEKVAISVPNLFENFVVISDKNANEVARKLGFIDENTSTKIDKDIFRIVNKYGRILVSSINDYIEVEKNVEVNVNEKKYNTKEYILALSEKELTKIVIDLLEILRDDDEAINMLAKYNTEMLSKEEISNLYNQLVEENESLVNSEKILEIKVNVLDGKTIRTTFNLNGTSEIEVVFDAEEKKDFVNVYLKVNGTVVELEYDGNMLEEKYEGKLHLKAAGEVITALELNIENVQNSTKKPRKISELNALLLDEATDEEIENLRKEIEKNIGIVDEEEVKMVYEEGEFKLDNPEERVNILEPSVSAYNKITIGATKEDVIKIMGEPSAAFEVDNRENMGWYFDEKNSIYYISVELTDGKISKVYNDIVSSMEDNVQISTELGTTIENLETIVSDLKYGMTKNEVVTLLGDKYLEISKNELGYKTYKWYDKRENIIIIEFDNEEKVSYVDEVMMDI